MGVLPPRSAHALPKCLADLMTDTSSEIADFYPTDFAIDLNGKTPNPNPDSEPKPKPKPNPSLNPNPNPKPNPHPNPSHLHADREADEAEDREAEDVLLARVRVRG